MKAITRIGTAAAVATALAGAFTGTASASPLPGHDNNRGRGDHAVFVQTDNVAGNQVVAYDRAENGALKLAKAYNTGGLGGVLTGSVVDHTASQGALAYDQAHGLLYAVNAGSNTISVFSVHGDQLSLRQTVSSGGSFPVSIAVHDNLVYVLNARQGGSVQGYVESHGYIYPVAGWNRPLNLDATLTPEFTTTPGQVGFSPDGSRLIVTTKGNGHDIDVFGVDFLGNLTNTAVVNAEPGALPFAFTFDRAGHLLVTETGIGSLVSFTLNTDNTLTQLAAVPTNQAATCWVTPAGRFLYTGNAGSASLTGFSSSLSGALTDLGNTGTDPGTIDAAATPDGRYLYSQAGKNGNVDEFRVNHDGSLTAIGSVTVAGAAGGEGIVAS